MWRFFLLKIHERYSQHRVVWWRWQALDLCQCLSGVLKRRCTKWWNIKPYDACNSHPPKQKSDSKAEGDSYCIFFGSLAKVCRKQIVQQKMELFHCLGCCCLFFSQRPREQLENLEVGDISQSAAPILLKKHGERKVRHPRNTKRHWKKISENLSFFLQKSIQFLSIIFRKGKWWLKF